MMKFHRLWCHQSPTQMRSRSLFLVLIRFELVFDAAWLPPRYPLYITNAGLEPCVQTEWLFLFFLRPEDTMFDVS